MKAIYFLSYLLCILIWSSCIPTRVGKVKLISTDKLIKGESVYFVRPFYTYATFGNSFTCAACTEKTEQQIYFEHVWDSIQYNVANKFFTAKKVIYGKRGEKQEVRPFRFKILLGGPEEINADTTSYMLAKFTWNIRAGKKEEAMKYIPDTLLQLSNSKPVLIITNDFHFYEMEFQSYYASGTTGMNFIPDCLLVVLYKEEIQYFRGFRKRYKLEKVFNNHSIIENITLQIFDKIK